MEFRANSPLIWAILRAALLICGASWFVMNHPLGAQADLAAQTDPQSNTLSYEVVSIKPHKSVGDAGGGSLPDGFSYRGVTLELLITSAYDIDSDQVSGLPGWVRSNYYDIEAKVDADTAAAWKKLSPQEVSAQQEMMMRSLLANRCQFKAHFETKELPAYDLVIAKGGLKMKEAPPEEKHDGMLAEGNVRGRSTSLDALVTNLSAWSGRMVVDQTGLGEKRFDFDLKWTPDNRRATDPANLGPSIFTALEEQLGLKLVPGKAPVQVLVIDQIERPSEN
jgi:uncharacterized protein (TIGR03435 family)